MSRWGTTLRDEMGDVAAESVPPARDFLPSSGHSWLRRATAIARSALRRGYRQVVRLRTFKIFDRYAGQRRKAGIACPPCDSQAAGRRMAGTASLGGDVGAGDTAIDQEGRGCDER